MNINANRLLKLAAFVAFVVAFIIAYAGSDIGTFPEWIAAGLAITTLAEVV